MVTKSRRYQKIKTYSKNIRRKMNFGCHQRMNQAVSYRKKQEANKDRNRKRSRTKVKPVKWKISDNNQTLFKEKNKFVKVIVTLVNLTKPSQFWLSIKWIFLKECEFWTFFKKEFIFYCPKIFQLLKVYWIIYIFYEPYFYFLIWLYCL